MAQLVEHLPGKCENWSWAPQHSLKKGQVEQHSHVILELGGGNIHTHKTENHREMERDRHTERHKTHMHRA